MPAATADSATAIAAVFGRTSPPDATAGSTAAAIAAAPPAAAAAATAAAPAGLSCACFSQVTPFK